MKYYNFTKSVITTAPEHVTWYMQDYIEYTRLFDLNATKNRFAR